MTEVDLMDTALLGEEAKKFVESDLYKTLIERAKTERLALLEQYAELEDSDSKKRFDIKVELAVMQKFPLWLNEIIGIGEEAHTQWVQNYG